MLNFHACNDFTKHCRCLQRPCPTSSGRMQRLHPDGGGRGALDGGASDGHSRNPGGVGGAGAAAPPGRRGARGLGALRAGPALQGGWRRSRWPGVQTWHDQTVQRLAGPRTVTDISLEITPSPANHPSDHSSLVSSEGNESAGFCYPCYLLIVL